MGDLENVVRIAGAGMTPEFRAKLERELGVDWEDNELPDWNASVVLMRCNVCGGEFPEHLKSSPDRCRCERARLRNAEALDEIDPYQEMTLRSIRGGGEGITRSLVVAMHILGQDRKKGLVMVGPPGNGKTHVLVGACREALDFGRIAIWRNFANLITEIQGSYSDHEGEDRRQIIENLAKHEIVILDDIGKEKQSEDVEGITYEIIDTLYRQRRTVMAASNLDEVAIARRYDRAVADRLRHMCEFVAVTGESRRGSVDY